VGCVRICGHLLRPLVLLALTEAACSGQDPEHRPLKNEYGSVGVSYDKPAA